MEPLIALVALTAMEIVLGIDNIVFLAILTGRLPPHQQPKARLAGLGLAMIARVLLLLTISWIMTMNQPFLHLSDLAWLQSLLGKISPSGLPPEVDGISVKDLIVLAGGLFLVGKSVHEIHAKLEDGTQRVAKSPHAGLAGVLAQIVVVDLVFSLDSVITAVGMAKDVKVMIAAVVIAIVIMMVFSGAVSRFIDRHPTLKMLALSFLILIGVMLIAEGIGTHIDKGYIYFAMAFALGVEMLNLRVQRHTAEHRTS